MKRLLAALVSISMIFIFTGCSNTGQASGPSNGSGNKMAYQKPNVYGEVAAIKGNKVTLKLLKIPQFTGRYPQRTQNGNGTGMRQGGGNSNGGGKGGFGMGRQRAKQYTGEVKTIEIPNGVTLTTMLRGQNGMTQLNISLNQVTTGSVMSIYDNSDGKTIKSIRVQQPRTGNGQQASNSNA